MHGEPISLIVYKHLFPRRGENYPISFTVHLSRNLIPEVRKETQCFYGTLDGIEAQYPGLDYSYPPHRMRLSRFPWHRRLFRAFDDLGLTPSEIAGLCKWEGTLHAKEMKESEEGIKIKDTTGDDITVWVPSREPRVQQAGLSMDEHMSNSQDRNGDAEDVEESDEEIESVGTALNQQLIARAAARQRGEVVVLDEEWEQWLKEAAERGALENVPGGLVTWPPVYSRPANANTASPSTAATAPGHTSAPAAVSTRIAL